MTALSLNDSRIHKSEYQFGPQNIRLPWQDKAETHDSMQLIVFKTFASKTWQIMTKNVTLFFLKLKSFLFKKLSDICAQFIVKCRLYFELVSFKSDILLT